MDERLWAGDTVITPCNLSVYKEMPREKRSDLSQTQEERRQEERRGDAQIRLNCVHEADPKGGRTEMTRSNDDQETANTMPRRMLVTHWPN